MKITQGSKDSANKNDFHSSNKSRCYGIVGPSTLPMYRVFQPLFRANKLWWKLLWCSRIFKKWNTIMSSWATFLGSFFRIIRRVSANFDRDLCVRYRQVAHGGLSHQTAKKIKDVYSTVFLLMEVFYTLSSNVEHSFLFPNINFLFILFLSIYFHILTP